MLNYFLEFMDCLAKVMFVSLACYLAFLAGFCLSALVARIWKRFRNVD